MRAQITITDLSPAQAEALDVILLTSYDFSAGQTRMCVVFEIAPGVERHLEMPRAELSTALGLLELVAKNEKAATEAEYHAQIDRYSIQVNHLVNA